MSMVFNLEEVDEKKVGAFEVMPKGEYEAIIDDYSFEESKKGAPMIKWTFKILDEEFENRQLFYYTVMNNKFGLANLKKLLINIDAEINWVEFDPEDFVEQGEAIGAPIRIKVDIQKYNGEDRNNVKSTLPSQDNGTFIDY